MKEKERRKKERRAAIDSPPRRRSRSNERRRSLDRLRHNSSDSRDRGRSTGSFPCLQSVNWPTFPNNFFIASIYKNCKIVECSGKAERSSSRNRDRRSDKRGRSPERRRSPIERRRRRSGSYQSRQSRSHSRYHSFDYLDKAI